MQLTASDIITLHRPTPCDLRVYLREQGVPEAEPSELEKILQTLGQRHEEEHLATLGTYEDPSLVRPEERVQRTNEAIRDRAPVIYQGELARDIVLNGIPVTLVGRPDFLIWADVKAFPDLGYQICPQLSVVVRAESSPKHEMLTTVGMAKVASPPGQ
ncbi:MAG TPA: hypothetical protein VII23_12190 [Terriglobales bacterium]